MAHELLSYEYYGGNVPPITAASDTWAFGMTVLEVRSPLPHVANWSNEYTCTGPDTYGANAILLVERQLHRYSLCHTWRSTIAPALSLDQSRRVAGAGRMLARAPGSKTFDAVSRCVFSAQLERCFTIGFPLFYFNCYFNM
jgi:hypothetical protein